MSGLNTAQLAIYSALSLPVIYILIRHGRPGLMGWFYLLAFCSLRVVGGGMSLSSDKSGTPSTTATTISSIGLSPLLIGISGILHEAYDSHSLQYPFFESNLTNLSLVAVGIIETRISVRPGNGHLWRFFI